MMKNISVIYSDLPKTINGAVHQISENEYWIFINKSLSDEEKIHTMKHEILHIHLDHFCRNIDAIECEKEIEEWIGKDVKFDDYLMTEFDENDFSHQKTLANNSK